MTEKVTVSAKIEKEKWNKIKEYGIDTSATIRKSIDNAIRDKELEDFRRLMQRTRPILKKITKDDWMKSIREDRESR
jgi:hypothetical protein